VNVLARKTLVDFFSVHADAREALEAWYVEASRAKWTSPEEIKARYPKASIVANNRVVFNICGNKYRLLCALHYERGYAYIKFIGTHAEYDRIDVETYNGRPS
jgi:mRNA interferase HigB